MIERNIAVGRFPEFVNQLIRVVPTFDNQFISSPHRVVQKSINRVAPVMSCRHNNKVLNANKKKG